MRNRSKKGKIIVNTERCKGCKYCILACPRGCIGISEKFNLSGYFPAKFLNSNNCTGCTMCAVVCPEIAIEIFVQD